MLQCPAYRAQSENKSMHCAALPATRWFCPYPPRARCAGQRIVARWAERLDAKRAHELGFGPATFMTSSAHILRELAGKIALTDVARLRHARHAHIIRRDLRRRCRHPLRKTGRSRFTAQPSRRCARPASTGAAPDMLIEHVGWGSTAKPTSSCSTTPDKPSRDVDVSRL